MMPLALLIALIALPFLLIVKWRSNGAIVFLALCLGFVLATFIAADFADVITAITRGSMLSTTQWSQVVLLTIPLLLAALLTKGSIGRSRLAPNLLSALVVGSLYALLVIEYLPTPWQQTLQNQFLWRDLNSAMTLILIVGAGVVMLALRGPQLNRKEGKKARRR